MKSITYIQGDATNPQANGAKIIIHICNNIGGWGKGFVLAISKRWKSPEEAYRNWYKQNENNDFELGNIQTIQVSKDISVINMLGQQGIKTGNNGVPIRYNAVEQCLQKVTKEAIKQNASVHMPRIGCGLAGGTWDKIEPIIKKTLLTNDIDTYVYDFG